MDSQYFPSSIAESEEQKLRSSSHQMNDESHHLNHRFLEENFELRCTDNQNNMHLQPSWFNSLVMGNQAYDIYSESCTQSIFRMMEPSSSKSHNFSHKHEEKSLGQELNLEPEVKIEEQLQKKKKKKNIKIFSAEISSFWLFKINHSKIIAGILRN